MNKKCKECGALKIESEYYDKDKSCKECRKKKVRAHREANLEKIRAYDRARGQTEKRKQKNKDYQAYMKSNFPEKWRESRKKVVSKNRKKNHEKYIANSRVRYATSTGKLKREPCFVCGALKVEAHHSDYNKPLDVVWLCDYHHKEEHKRLRAQERSSTPF